MTTKPMRYKIVPLSAIPPVNGPRPSPWPDDLKQIDKDVTAAGPGKCLALPFDNAKKMYSWRNGASTNARKMKLNLKFSARTKEKIIYISRWIGKGK